MLAAVLVAGPLYAVQGRPGWFLGDEWVFLTNRGLDAENLFRPHNQHWTTLPVLVYRALWNVVGLNSYRPYQAITIGLHLVIVLLLRTVMRRSGVRPWAATVGAATLLFYGHGSENVLWAFQMSFLGSIALGLAHLLLADHPATSRRRAAGAIACGVGAVMCSGVGLIMVGIVGLTIAVRRGIRAAILTTAPVVAIYAVWWVTYGRDEETTEANGPRAIARFVFDGVRHALESGAGGTPMGLLVILVTVLGLAVAVANRRTATSAGLRNRLAAPGAMALGALASTWWPVVRGGRPSARTTPPEVGSPTSASPSSCRS